MADFLTASLVFALLVFSVSVSAGQRIITAKPGDNATLTCGEVQNKDVIVVQWNRTDLKSEKPVLLYRLSQSVPEDQSPFFKDRVDLVAMKNGDVSLVLKNVTTDDTGTYECRVVQGGNNRRKRSLLDTEPICTFNLTVEPHQRNITAEPGNTNVTCKDANQGNTSRKRRSVENNCNNPGNEENGRSWTGLIAGLSVFGLVVVVVGAVLYKRSRYSSLKSKCPPAAVIGEATLKELLE